MRSKVEPAAVSLRWAVALPSAGLGVALTLLLLATLAENAFRSRHALALEGRFLRLAHRLEVELREQGPEAAGGVLEEGLLYEPELVAGLVLMDSSGEVEAHAGLEGAGGAPAYDVELFVGRLWAHRGGRGPAFGRVGYGGIRTLRLVETTRARRRPIPEVLLLPAVALVGLFVVALAFLGGRLLTRQQETTRLEARRRRLEGLGRAGAGLAHQLRTPLATIKGSCQLLLEDAQPAVATRLAVVVEQSERMERLLGQLLDYARPPDPQVHRVVLGSLLDELEDFEPRLEVTAGRELCIEADPDHLRQILVNLVGNAAEASPPEVGLTVSAHRRGPRVEIEVLDRGDGPGEDPETLFEPYVTRREGGTGLGLPIARALAEANGGELRLEARTGGGTRAVLQLSSAAGGTP